MTTINDIFKGWEVRFEKSPKWRAWIRQGAGDWQRYPVKKALFLLTYGAEDVTDQGGASASR